MIMQDAAQQPSVVGTVPGVFVHKADPSEILLTGWRAWGHDRFSVSARWPKEHRFRTTAHGTPDALLLIEAVRQSIPLLCHVAYGVPFGHRQSWIDFGFRLEPAGLAMTEAPERVELAISCENVVRRGQRLTSARLRVEVLADDLPVATVHTAFANLAPEVYARLRGPYADLEWATGRSLPPPPPLAPARVGRTRHEDVLLAPFTAPATVPAVPEQGRYGDRAAHTGPDAVGRAAQLRVDLTHPVFFDHPVDHVPGLLLLEAARQAAYAHARPRRAVLAGMDCVFVRFAELDSRCAVTCDPLPGDAASPPVGTSLVTVVQGDSSVFSAVVSLAEPPGR
jgi:hypothetical protein